MLTIAIPTYNRNEKLLQQLERLLVQAEVAHVELLVVDNCSPEAVEPFLAKSLSEKAVRVRIVRNAGNIGVGGNILRCIEEARGTWVWLLGDDDPVLGDSISTALKATDNADDHTFMIKTGCAKENYPFPKKVTTAGLPEISEMCRNAWFFSNLLHISSTILNREKALAYLNYGYHWNYSLAPHLAMLFAALRDNHQVLLYPQEQFKSGGYDRGSWSIWRQQLGVPTLLELDGCDQYMREWLISVFAQWMGRRWFFTVLAIVLRGGARSPDYWRSYCLRLASVSSMWRSMYLVAIAIFLCPLIRVPFVRKLVSRLFGQRRDPSLAERS